MSWGEIGDALNSTKKNPNLFKPLDEWLKYRGGDIAYEYESAGTFSLTVPEWATIAIVTACGGGGGGNYSPYDSSVENNVPGIGGAGGCAICNEIYAVTAGASLSITVGKGGAGGSYNSSTAPTAGGSTVIGSLVTLAGGAGRSTSSSGIGSGGAGKPGLTGGALGSDTYYGGGSLGHGGYFYNSVNVDSNVKPTRGGGGGGCVRASTIGSNTGQSGADGYVRIVFK